MATRYQYFIGRRIHHLVLQGLSPQAAMKKAAREWREEDGMMAALSGKLFVTTGHHFRASKKRK